MWASILNYNLNSSLLCDYLQYTIKFNWYILCCWCGWFRCNVFIPERRVVSSAVSLWSIESLHSHSRPSICLSVCRLMNILWPVNNVMEMSSDYTRTHTKTHTHTISPSPLAHSQYQDLQFQYSIGFVVESFVNYTSIFLITVNTYHNTIIKSVTHWILIPRSQNNFGAMMISVNIILLFMLAYRS